MAYLDDLDPSLDYDAQELAMKQAEARIAALRGMKAPTLPGAGESFTSAVTKTPVIAATPKMGLGAMLGQASPIIADYTAGRMENEALQRRTQLDAQQQKEIQDWYNRVPKGTPAIPGKTVVGEADVYENVGAQPAKPPTQEEMLRWAGEGSRFPKARGLADTLASHQLINIPAAQAAAQAQRELELLKERNKQIEDQKNRDKDLEVARIRSTNRPGAQGTWSGTGQFDTHGNPIIRHSITGETKVELPPPGAEYGDKTSPKPMTEGQRTESSALVSSANTFKNAFETHTPEMSGGLSGVGAFTGRYTPLGDSVYQFWRPIKKDIALENHRIYGANFTAGEQSRAGAYNPDPFNGEQNNLKALGQLAIDNHLALLRSNYIFRHPGAVMNPDGTITLPGGRVVDDTKSRLITDEEIRTQMLNPLPEYQDVPLRAPQGATPGPVPRPAAPPPPAKEPPPEPGVDSTFKGDPKVIMAAINRIPDPQERSNARAAYQRQLQREAIRRDVDKANSQLPKAKGADAERILKGYGIK